MDDQDSAALAWSWFGADSGAFDAAGVARLSVARRLRVDMARVPEAFRSELETWLGSADGTDESGRARYLADLRLRVGPDDFTTFKKAAVITVDTPRQTKSGWRIPIEWRAATFAPLFPVLVGELRIEPDVIALVGAYAPPFGVVGRALNRVLLSIAARRTGQWFLDQIAAVVGDARQRE